MVFSDLETALEIAPDIVAREEHDLYLCQTNYPSGVEYSLRDKPPAGFSCIKCFKLSIKHKFSTEKKARIMAKVFKERGNPYQLGVRPRYKEKNKYKIISHFAIVENK